MTTITTTPPSTMITITASMRRSPWSAVLRVVGRSMEPTLSPGDLLLTLPVAGQRGDVVVFHHASGARYAKRIAGVGGDVIELEAGRLRVNGRSIDGRAPVAGAIVARWRVPPGQVFVIGDNSHASDDSRTWNQPFVPAQATRQAVRLPNPVEALTRARHKSGTRRRSST